ncbi:AAA family ATPase [bacterium]|nr:AAA family ATPase [bacterium]
MLIEFRVENHRSLRDEQVLTMEAGRVGDAEDPRRRHVDGYSEALLTAAGIYGANASGKSNVLSALTFMRDAVLVSHRFWGPDEGIPRRAFAWGESATKPSLFEATFLESGIRYQYGFVVSDEQFLEEWLYAWPNGKKQVWFERDNDTPIKFGENLRGENRVIEEVTRPDALFLSAASQHRHAQLQAVAAWFRSMMPLGSLGIGRFGMPGYWRPQSEHVLARLLGDDPLSETQPSLFPDAEEDTFRDRFCELIRKADVGIVDVKVVTREIEDRPRRVSRKFYFQHQNSSDSWLPLEDESRGTQTLFRMALPVLRVLESGGVLIVDELEGSLHPALAHQIVRQFNDPAINQRGAQILFTTHDTNLLGTIVGEPALRRDQVWLTEKDPEGATVLYPLTDYKPRKAENLERGYLQGRYGAIPFLGDFSITGE